jgi:UrcA family protein
MRTTSGLRVALLAAGALLFAGGAASAQDYGYQQASYEGGRENVEVSVPRYHQQRSIYGVPYREISLSKNVYVGDLDLRTRHDARVLRDRVSHTARNLCRKLDRQYPITAPMSPGCYTTAMNDAMRQADDAIAYARGY